MSLDKRAFAHAAILGALLFASLTLAAVARDLVEQYYPSEIQPFCSWFPQNIVVAIAVMAIISTLLSVLFYRFLTRFRGRDSWIARARSRVFGLNFTRRDVALSSFVILVFWLPIIVLMYPTGLTVDTYNQLYQFDTTAPTYYPTTGESFDVEYIDHHPVFDTLLYGCFWWFGSILGNQNAGLFALVLLQSVLLAAELGFLSCYLERLGVPWLLRVATLVFCAWFPFFGHYAATVLKDVTYLTFFIPWALMWVEIFRAQGRPLNDLRFLVAFMVLGGLCILSKKTGLFLLVPCLIVLFGAFGRLRARIAVASCLSLALFCAVLPALVYPAIGGVAPGGSQEALGPAIQQVTATLRDDPECFSEEELEDLEAVLDVNKATRKYELFRTDGAKSAFRNSASSEDVMRFLAIWANKAVSHPGLYAGSTVMTSAMLFVPFYKLTYFDNEDYTPRAEWYRSLDTGFSVDIWRPVELVEASAYLKSDSIESKISDLPFVSLFFTEGFYGGWIPLFVLMTVLYARVGARGKNLLLALSPMLVCAALMLITPVASPRYMLPLLFTAPLWLGWAWYALLQKHKGGRIV